MATSSSRASKQHSSSSVFFVPYGIPPEIPRAGPWRFSVLAGLGVTSQDIWGCVTRSLEVRYKISWFQLMVVSCSECADWTMRYKMASVRFKRSPCWQRTFSGSDCPRRRCLNLPVSTSMPLLQDRPLDSPRWPYGTPHGRSEPDRRPFLKTAWTTDCPPYHNHQITIRFLNRPIYPTFTPPPAPIIEPHKTERVDGLCSRVDGDIVGLPARIPLPSARPCRACPA